MATKKKAAGPIPPPEAPAAATMVDAHVECAPEPMGNKYGVVADVWDKWSPEARALFNGLYAHMYDNQPLFRHPKAPMLENEQWKTVAWNAATAAADITRKD
jgi:hypothetical protein